jgi:nucleotide-binding universal stress UspA family protein
MNVRAVRRILVALDASSPSHAALEEAAALAAELHAELSGIFVVDAELLRLSALPMARETGLTSAQRRTLDPQAMERALKAQAEAARATLEATARRHRLQSTFRLSRGNVVSELIEAAAQTDLIAMGVIGHMGLAGKRLGSAARGVRARSRCSLLLTSRIHVGGTVVAVTDGGADSTAAVELADQLSRGREVDLVVLVCGTADRREALTAELEQRLRDRPSAATLEAIDPDAGCVGLRGALSRHGCGLLITGSDCELLAGRDDELCALDCPVLLTRAGEAEPVPGERAPEESSPASPP